jgi:hypothetical protein
MSELVCEETNYVTRSSHQLESLGSASAGDSGQQMSSRDRQETLNVTYFSTASCWVGIWQRSAPPRIIEKAPPDDGHNSVV